MPVITINGQIGSGAREIGLLVSEAMALDYVDRISLASAGVRVDSGEQILEDIEYQNWSLADQIFRLFHKALDRSVFSAGVGDTVFGSAMHAMQNLPYNMDYLGANPDDREEDATGLFELLNDVVRNVALQDNCVIVGRGSNFLLKDHGSIVSLGVVAEDRFKIETVRVRYSMNQSDAEHFVRQTERSRQAYYRKHFNVDPDDPIHYDLVLNPGKTGIQHSTDIAVQFCKIKFL